VKGRHSGKATAKKPVPASQKKQIKKKSLPAPVAPTRASAVVPHAKPKKKLTPREQKIQDIKKNLLAQRNTLLSEAEEALNALPGQTIFPDMGDQASAEIDRSFMLRLRGREQRLLKKIEQAIEKIDNGTFGVCDVCGEEITVKRLEARPVTNMCIFCKTEQEEEEKLRGGA
jgi:DnaK suppressor protein